MARPDRYRAREGAPEAAAPEGAEGATSRRTTLVEQPRPGTVTPASRDEGEQGLDDDAASRQSSRRGAVSEGELDLSRRVASRAGWVPLDQWKRDPNKWVDADIYLERMPQEVERLKDRARRTGAVADAAQDAARQAARVQADADVRAAVQAGDEDAAVNAARRVVAANGPDPRVLSWVARNPWFDKDPVAQAAAKAEATRRANAGESVEDQLDGSEALIRRIFPDHFPESRRPAPDEFEEDDYRPEPARDTRQDRPAGGEARLSDLRRERPAAPNVHGGSRGAGERGRQPKEKGWAEIPADEQAQMGRFVTRFSRRGLTVEQAQSQLGKEYWKNKGTQV